MSTLVCLGFGYSARHYVATFGNRLERIVGTVRSAAANGAPSSPPTRLLAFDGRNFSPELAREIEGASALIVSIPPGEDGDAGLAAIANLAGRIRLASIVYLSTVGVYGDHGGAFVDETTAPRPSAPRSRARLAAEAGWQNFGRRAQVPVAILRLAGIYGPGRNVLANLIEGKARRIEKPGQVFNRVHVADIARAIEAAIAVGADGVFNVADDEPAAPGDVLVFAAGLLGIPPPAPVPFAEAASTMSAMALSFYADNRRVQNHKIKAALEVSLRYPTYREGLRGLLSGLTARRPPP